MDNQTTIYNLSQEKSISASNKLHDNYRKFSVQKGEKSLTN